MTRRCPNLCHAQDVQGKETAKRVYFYLYLYSVGFVYGLLLLSYELVQPI